jgi:hypothetical protein
MKNSPRKPGIAWPLLLGAAGFAAGFFGPIVFVPDANQGPLVGIFITGPGGVVLGALLLAACTLLGISARRQWQALLGIAAAGVFAVLLFVQPGPALRGYVLDLEVESCATPIETEREVLDFWSRRIAEVTWAEARPGWQQDMRQKLRDAPGVVLGVRVRNQTSVWEKRKPWNRGELVATAGRNAPAETAFYDANGACADYPARHVFGAFESYDLNGPIEPPSEWPPGELEALINASPIVPVPAPFDRLARDAAAGAL